MKESMRIADHPILGADEPKKKVTIYYEGTPVEANEGEPIAVALANAGIRTLHVTEKLGKPRGNSSALKNSWCRGTLPTSTHASHACVPA